MLVSEKTILQRKTGLNIIPAYATILMRTDGTTFRMTDWDLAIILSDAEVSRRNCSTSLEVVTFPSFGCLRLVRGLMRKTSVYFVEYSTKLLNIRSGFPSWAPRKSQAFWNERGLAKIEMGACGQKSFMSI